MNRWIVLGWVFLLGVEGCDRNRETASPAALKRADEYAGAQACAPCHRRIYETWYASLHRRSMQEPSPQTVRGDFVRDTVYAYQGMETRLFTKDGSFFMATAGPDGKQGVYRVDYTIGDRDTQWYLTMLDRGHLQVMPVYYDLRQKRWYDPREGLIDHTGSLAPEDLNYWTNFGRNWNFQCFNCHASQIRKHYDATTDTYRTTWTDLSINCETCHGPGGRHIAFWRALPDRSTMRDTTLADLKRLDAEQSVEVCAQCHAHKQIVDANYAPGGAFYDHYAFELLDSPNFWPDGRSRVLTYNALAFTMSACYLQGHLVCTRCHDSHHLGLPRRWETYDAVCLACHRADVGDPAIRHGHHRAQDAGCIACHMPVLDEVKRIRVRDHRIASPAPENTVRLGIPNACGQVGCHADKTAQWAGKWVRTWWGDRNDPVATAQAVARGRAGDVRAVAPLIKMLRDPKRGPVLRGTAAVLLGRLGDRRAQDALEEALHDPHPQVRAEATEGLGHLNDASAAPALSLSLSDASRLVRMRAALSLKAIGPPPADSSGFSRAMAEYADMVSLLADDPNAQIEQGIAHLNAGQEDSAVASFSRALRIWPGSPDARAGLATVYARQGRFSESVAMWRQAASRDSTLRAPLVRACELWAQAVKARLARGNPTADDFTALGDSYAIRDSISTAIRYYEQALAIAPDRILTRRNLALAYAQAGMARAARAQLDGVRKLAGAPAARELAAHMQALMGKPEK